MDGKVVYGQKDLENALLSGEKNVILCAGIYTIPIAKDTVFSRLGPVIAEVRCSAEAAAAEGMRFDGVEPVFVPRYAIDKDDPMRTVSATEGIPTGSGSFLSGYFGSGSYGGSFGSGSFGSGGYYYEYEFEYELGRGSFAGSFGASNAGSYGASFRYGSGSSGTGMFSVTEIETELPERFIRVFGYGIDLI